NSEGVGIAYFTVFCREPQRGVAPSPRADDNLPDAVFLVAFPFRCLWRKSFVGVFVASKNQIGMRLMPVAVSKFLKCSLVVGEIACCKDGSRDLFDEFRGRFGAQEISAPGDVPCSDQREFFPTTVHAGLWRALRFRARLLPKSCSS